ncbi:MAG TPA: hypothetical protein VL418_10740 [Devosiaceae bacterium]|nr:hypothetical protein [Devosiaceae bacterium]
MNTQRGAALVMDPWLAKIVGSIIGVSISMIMVAPRNWANAVYRGACSIPAGVIFAPAVQKILWFLDGSGLEFHLAAGCAAGFSTWFVLEATARFLSSKDTIRRLLEEMVRLGGPDHRDHE